MLISKWSYKGQQRPTQELNVIKYSRLYRLAPAKIPFQYEMAVIIPVRSSLGSRGRREGGRVESSHLVEGRGEGEGKNGGREVGKEL